MIHAGSHFVKAISSVAYRSVLSNQNLIFILEKN